MVGANQCEAYSEWTSELQTEISCAEKVGFGDDLLVIEEQHGIYSRCWLSGCVYS